MRDYKYSIRLYRADGTCVPVAANEYETVSPTIQHGIGSGEFVRAEVRQRVPGGWVRLFEVSRENA